MIEKSLNFEGAVVEHAVRDAVWALDTPLYGCSFYFRTNTFFFSPVHYIVID